MTCRRAGVPGILLLVLGALVSCGEGPTRPEPRSGGRLGIRLIPPKGEAGRFVDSLRFSVFTGGRRIAGPEEQEYDGGFEAALRASAGPARVAVVAGFGDEAGLGAGALVLGVSSPFTLGGGDTATVEVALESFLTNFDETQGVYTGSARLSWRRVPGATRYTVREEIEGGNPVDRSVSDSTIVIPAGSVVLFRTFRVRAENVYATGAFSNPVSIEIIPVDTGPAWTVLHDGTGASPGIRYYQASAWSAVSRTIYVLGGFETPPGLEAPGMSVARGAGSVRAVAAARRGDIAGNVAPAGTTVDSVLWAFSAVTNRWTTVSSGAAGGPSPRYYGALAVSPDGAFVYCFGGVDLAGTLATRLDLWRFDLSAHRWTLLEPTDEANRVELPFDASVESFLWAPPSAPGVLRLFVPSTSEIWTYNLGQRVWSPPAAAGDIPPREFPAYAFDPEDERLFVFGGAQSLTENTNDSTLWVWNEAAPTWSVAPAAAAGHAPARFYSGGASKGNGGFLFLGGLGEFTTGFQDVWEYVPPTRTGGGFWKDYPTGNEPLGLLNPCLVYDAALNRVITYGGGGSAAVRALNLSQFEGAFDGKP